MDPGPVIDGYFEALEAGDVAAILELFVDGAVVRSPVYGEMPAEEFYPRLSQDTASSEIEVLDRFVSREGSFAAVHFRYRWTLQDGTVQEIEGMDVFDLAGDGRIRGLTIVYDAEAAREAVEGLE